MNKHDELKKALDELDKVLDISVTDSLKDIPEDEHVESLQKIREKNQAMIRAGEKVSNILKSTKK